MNNYHIYEEVGRGKDSVVYKGRIKKSIKYVAVKSVERTRRKKLLNEVRILQELEHTNIVKFYSSQETRNHLWIVLEYCPGGDMIQMLEQDKKIPEASIKQLAKQLVEGLSYLHQQGVIYSDLKPHSIMLNEYATLKFCDFGLAKKITDQELAETGKPKAGTPYYMAPELFSDIGVHSFQSDFWSLGCLLYELATGKPPFNSSSLKELITQIVNTDYPRLEGFSTQFTDLISRLLDKEPLKRMNWDELKSHAFFAEHEFVKRIYPYQLQFDAYLKARGIVPEHYYQMRNNPLAKKLALAQSSNPVDIMRLSHNVRKNMKHEEDHEAGGNGREQYGNKQEEQDVKIQNRKMILNFGEKEEEEEESKANSGSSTPSNYHSAGGGSHQAAFTQPQGAQEIAKSQVKSVFQQQRGSNGPQPQIKKLDLFEMLEEQPLTDKINIQQTTSSKKQLQQAKSQPKRSGPNPALMLLISKQLYSTQAKNPQAKTVDQLLIHNSDNSVKPIIGNKEIEKQVETYYDPQQLTFQPWSPDQVLQNLESPQIESLLNDLYSAIAQNQNLALKLNSLLYFESIIINSNVSNRLINSAFMDLLLKNLKLIKTPQVRIRICSVLGLLIRHSTVIENEVAESELFPQMIETLKDKSESVRKKAIPALGEYMFYAATQLDDEQADPCWEIPDEAIQIVIRSLRTEEDEIVRFYACKTLENITAQSSSAGGRFATVEAAQYLIQIFLNTHLNDNLRTSSAVALCNVVRLQPKLFALIMSKIGTKQYCFSLAEGQSKVQQALITLINQALYQNLYPKLNEALLQEEMFLKALIKLLEHHSIVIRGKVLLTFNLLFKLDFRWMAIVDPEVKFFHVLDRLARDNYKYIQCCLQCLVDSIIEIMPSIFSLIAEELTVLMSGGRPSNLPSEFDKKLQRNEYEQLSGNLVFISIILDLQQALAIKNKLISPPFIRSLAILIDNCTGQDFQGSEEFLNALLLITESMNQNQKILLQMNEPITQFMLPVLVEKFKSESADIRFLSLKIFTDILIQYLNDESLYDPFNGKMNPTTQQLSDLINLRLFPAFSLILQDIDPVPLFGLKLLSAMLEINPQQFSQQLKAHQLYPYLTENYQVNHPRLNRHTLNIIRILLQTKEMSLEEVLDSQIIEKTSSILKSMVTNKQDWCTEILLEIMTEVMNLCISIAKEQDMSRLSDDLSQNFELLISMLNPQQYESNMTDKASQALILMLQLYALCNNRKREIYFVESHLSLLLLTVKTDKRVVQKRLLKCIYWALIQSEYQLKLTKDKRRELEQTIIVLISQAGEDKSIANTCKEIMKLMSEQQQESSQQQINFYR